MDQHKAHYDTVSNAITKLRNQGFTIDFKLDGDFINSGEDQINCNDFTIVDVYRYEGNTDPSDEAVVYGIEAISGKKGILVTGYGISADSFSTKMLEKLRFS